MQNKINICGVSINNLTMVETLKKAESIILSEKGRALFFVNVDLLMKAQNIEVKSILERATLLLADGMPLLWAAKFLDKPLKEKVSGSDLFPRLCEVASKKGYKVFFLGGKSGAAEKAKKILKDTYQKIEIVGVYSPPFGFESNPGENGKIINMIKNSAPHILFVGLGAPKQEKWITKYKDELGVPLSVAVGGTFDIFSGHVRRAPLWMQRAGLEWLWRLGLEPRRLWRRYLIEDMEFFKLVFKQKNKKF